MTLRTPAITRRSALMGAGSFAALTALPLPARAEAPMLGLMRPMVYRFKLGAFEVTTILDGAIQLDGPHPIFGENVTQDDVAALAAENNLPATRMEVGFTVTLVNTGAALILFDSGNGDTTGRRPNAGLTRERLALAGYTPEQVDVVAMTHFHPDHIGGLTEAGAVAYPNASYRLPPAEFDFWSPEDKAETRVGALVQSNVIPLMDKAEMIAPGAALVSGIEAMDASGHTPGHTTYHIESEGERLLIGGDFCNHYVMSLQRPDWHVRFDMDKEAAVARRKEILGMLAADKIPFVGYHMPAPSVGYVAAEGDSFRYVAASYQLNL